MHLCVNGLVVYGSACRNGYFVLTADADHFLIENNNNHNGKKEEEEEEQQLKCSLRQAAQKHETMVGFTDDLIIFYFLG